MHLFACEHPKRIHNPYLDEDMFVPCGECDICRAKKSLSWSERLELERSCHPYTLFGTLTYAEEFLPKFYPSADGFLDIKTGELVPYSDISNDILDNNSIDFVRSRECLPVGSVTDCQKFIKRIRSKVLHNPSSERRADRYVRYFLVCELGETCFRPHYHFIFYTSSKWFAEHAKDVVASCWKTDDRRSDSKELGIVDCQNVQASAASYVAGYLNSFVSSPKIYRHKRFKPFCLFSKSPSLGSLFSNEKEVQELFHSGNCELSVYRRKTNEYVRVPFSKALCDRLYPKIVRFNEFSGHVISNVYGLASYGPWSSFGDFEEFLRQRMFRTFDGVSEYLKVIFDNNMTDSKSCLKRLYSVMNRILIQSNNFKVSPVVYGQRIIEFYKKCDYACLKSQLECEVELADKHGSKACLLSDLVFVDNLSRTSFFSPRELNLIKSYEVVENICEKTDFLADLDFSQTLDFINLRSKCSKIVNEHRKKVAKNEYLEFRTKDLQFINFLKSYHGL